MTNLKWRFGVLAGVVLMICALYPQMKMWYLRGADWQGAYAYNDIDEVAYAAYLSALIDGRPRKNDPYTGRDESPESPQPESLFSIQFAAPYSIAVPARILGVSASTAMTASGAIAAFLSGLALFWLVGRMTGDSLFAMTGTLVVVCGGALAAGEGAIGEILGTGFPYPYFPGLRRYVPAMPFAAFFVFCGSVWALMTAGADLKKRLLFGALAGACFAFCVFSYFYIWTTAAAWLACLALAWLAARPEGWLRDVKSLAVLGAFCLIPLGFYALLLANRAQTMDHIQLLVYTRQPDLLRVPALLSYSVVVMTALAVFLKAVNLKDRSTLFVFSLAASVVVVFNQQVITGRSLQPIHYQVFIGNYVAALALVLTFGSLRGGLGEKRAGLSRAMLSALALVAGAWGIVECHYTVRVLDEANVERDTTMPVSRRLRELSATDVPSPGSQRAVVLAFGLVQGDELPTVAPQALLWARHQHVFAGLGWEESKERYYQYLYYLSLDEKWLERSMRGGDFISMIALFGWGRHTDRLSADAKPLTVGEIREEAARFGEYRRSFDFAKASYPTLSYVVVPTDWNPDFTNLDRWYERDAGEFYGDFVLYRVKLKPPQ